MIRHLRALPRLRGFWCVWPPTGRGRWIIPADPEAESMGIPYLRLRPGNAGVRPQVVGR